MKTLFCFRACLAALFVFSGDAVFSTPLQTNVLNKHTLLDGKWNTTNSPTLKEFTSSTNDVHHFFEPQLITFLFRKLLTRTHNLKERMKHVADSFVASYFNPENYSVVSKFSKAGKEDAPNFIPESYKLGKKTYKRSVNKKLESHEEEIKKTLSFSPVVQFIPASLDLSNKIMFYQPQLIINGSVYIEQDKDPKPSQLQEMFDLTRNRSNVTNA